MNDKLPSERRKNKARLRSTTEGCSRRATVSIIISVEESPTAAATMSVVSQITSYESINMFVDAGSCEIPVFPGFAGRKKKKKMKTRTRRAVRILRMQKFRMTN